MTTAELIESLRPALGFEGQPDDPLLWRITQAIPTALEALARLVSESPATRRLLTKTFTVAITNGEGSLATPLAAAEPLLLDKVDKAAVYITGVEMPLRQLPDRGRQQLEADDRYSYVIDDSVMVIKGTEGLGTYTDNATIRSAPFVPTLANLPDTLDGQLTAIVAGMVAVPKKAARVAPPQST